jgi:hypothetical protein
MTHFIVHYHMRPGGVSRVILAEIAYNSQVIHNSVLISAESAGLEFATKIIPALDYAKQTFASEDEIFSQLMAAAQEFPQPWIWHIHNPTLGCHPLFTSCCQRLAAQNEHVIYHIHDFAEDQRPRNLKQLLGVGRLCKNQRLYPVSERMHYCVLTGRDRDILMAAGLPQHQVSVLPNPVQARALPPSDRLDPWVLYPVRAIDRKNIGEFLLLSALAPAASRFAITRGPGESLHQKHYTEWVQFAHNHSLPVDFALAETEPAIDLEHWIGQSTHLCSTSAHEGFGMAFLESIAWQRPLLGRAIPHIQADLAEAGIDHPYLYQALLSELFPGIDFPQLSIKDQQQVILSARTHPASVEVLLKNGRASASEWLSEVLQHRKTPLTTDQLHAFSPQRHGELLRQLAERLASKPASPCHYLDANAIRKFFTV